MLNINTDYKNIFLKIIKAGVILILFTPLILGPFGLSLSNYPKTVFFRALTEIIFIFYLLLIFFDSKYLPKISLLVLTVSVFTGILILTSLTGINFYRSFWGGLHRVEGVILHLHLLVFFLILISVFHRKEDWLKFFKLTVIVSAVSSLAGILQKLGAFSFYGLSLPNRISGTWTNPDFFAPYIVLAIFLAIFVLAAERKKKWKVVWASILILNCYTLILSKTRSAWIGAGIGMIFLFSFWFFGYAKLSQKKRRLILLGILALSIFFLLIILNQGRLSLSENSFFQRVVSIFDPRSLASRLSVWEIALEAWEDRPILGWGPESFSFLFDKYFKASNIPNIPEYLYFDRPHNKVLEIMATTGILGLLSYLSMFFAIFYLLFRYLKNNKKPILGLILVAFFISYFIQNLACFDTLGTYLIFFLVLGFIHHHFSPKNGDGFINKQFLPAGTSNKFLKVVFIIPLILITLIVFYQLNFKTTKASLAFVQGAQLERTDSNKALSEYKEAISKNTIFDKDFKKELIVRLIFILENFEVSKDAEVAIIEILSGLKSFMEEELEKPDKRYLELHELLARTNERIYLLSGDLKAIEEMEEVSKKALNFSGQKREFYVLIGKAKIHQGNYSEGESFFQKAFELGPGHFQDRIELYRRLAIAYLRAGNKLMAAKNFKKALDRKFCLEKLKPNPSAEDIKTTLNFAQALAKIYCQELNNPETCRQIYERAIEIYPDYQKQLQSNLETLLIE